MCKQARPTYSRGVGTAPGGGGDRPRWPLSAKFRICAYEGQRLSLASQCDGQVPMIAAQFPLGIHADVQEPAPLFRVENRRQAKAEGRNLLRVPAMPAAISLEPVKPPL